ncbi:MAG: hypothetical protein ACFBSG_12610 [Leptolyngbyaceae cyanobacterium]
MENKKPVFGIADYSPIEISSALHSFSRDMQSYYKMAQGHLLGKLDHTEDEAELTQLKAELQAVHQKIEYFHMLNNAASICSTVLHTPLLVEEFRQSNK